MLPRVASSAVLCPLKGTTASRERLRGTGRNGAGMRARGRRGPLGSLGRARHYVGR